MSSTSRIAVSPSLVSSVLGEDQLEGNGLKKGYRGGFTVRLTPLATAIPGAPKVSQSLLSVRLLQYLTGEQAGGGPRRAKLRRVAAASAKSMLSTQAAPVPPPPSRTRSAPSPAQGCAHRAKRRLVAATSSSVHGKISSPPRCRSAPVLLMSHSLPFRLARLRAAASRRGTRHREVDAANVRRPGAAKCVRHVDQDVVPLHLVVGWLPRDHTRWVPNVVDPAVQTRRGPGTILQRLWRSVGKVDAMGHSSLVHAEAERTRRPKRVHRLYFEGGISRAIVFTGIKRRGGRAGRVLRPEPFDVGRTKTAQLHGMHGGLHGGAVHGGVHLWKQPTGLDTGRSTGGCELQGSLAEAAPRPRGRREAEGVERDGTVCNGPEREHCMHRYALHATATNESHRPLTSA